MSTLSIPIAPARITVEEFSAKYENRRVELVKGVVKELSPSGLNHGKICMRIGALIYAHVEAHDLGHVMSDDSWVRTGPESVRGADVLFYSYARLPKGTAIPDKFHTLAPELVVEVKSPSDLWTDLFTKVIEYIAAGVRFVVVLDAGKATVSVYHDNEQDVYRMGDEITFPDILPGFSVSVAKLFA